MGENSHAFAITTTGQIAKQPMRENVIVAFVTMQGDSQPVALLAASIGESSASQSQERHWGELAGDCFLWRNKAEGRAPIFSVVAAFCRHRCQRAGDAQRGRKAQGEDQEQDRP